MTPDEPERLLRRARHTDWSKDELLELITKSAGATLAAVDRGLQMVYVNEEYARWFGSTPELLVGKTLVDLYGEHDCARFMPFVERVLSGERVQYQRLLRTPYGFDEWRTICLTPWPARNGVIDGFITTALDVHELQVTMNALRAANQRLSSHMENSPLAVLEMDQDLRLLHCSQRAVQLMGWLPVAHLEGRSLTQLLGHTSDEGLHEALQRLQEGQEAQNRAETSFTRQDGSEVHCEWFNSALTDAEGRVTSIMALVQDVSAKIQIARQQQYLANHDSLTGLYNRAAFHSRLEQSLARVRHHAAGSVALLFIDLDGFKGVNDTEGHRAGDEVLRIVARRLAATVRGEDTMARLGGDEFLVMLDREVTRDVTDGIGQRIIEALQEPMWVEGRELRIGASIGVAVHPPLEGETDALMNRADQAMYAAKRAGKGRLHYAQREPLQQT